MDYLLKIVSVFINVPVIFVLLTVHSVTKVLISLVLGDQYPKNNGRLSLNPLRHTDAIGFLLLFFTFFGWDKPIRTSSLYYKNKKLGTILVNLVPVLACFVLSAISVFVYKHFVMSIAVLNPWLNVLGSFLNNLAIMGLSFGIFNLIPIYPLDGSGILRAYLSPNQIISYSSIEGILQMILVFAVMLGLLSSIIYPVTASLYSLMPLIL